MTRRRMVVHLHDEQFDAWLHAWCGSLDPVKPPSARVVDSETFEQTPIEKRCRFCASYWWPNGGES